TASSSCRHRYPQGARSWCHGERRTKCPLPPRHRHRTSADRRQRWRDQRDSCAVSTRRRREPGARSTIVADKLRAPGCRTRCASRTLTRPGHGAIVMTAPTAESLVHRSLHLTEVGRALARERDAARLLDIIVAEAILLCNADGGALYRVDRKSTRLNSSHHR